MFLEMLSNRLLSDKIEDIAQTQTAAFPSYQLGTAAAFSEIDVEGFMQFTDHLALHERNADRQASRQSARGV